LQALEHISPGLQKANISVPDSSSRQMKGVNFGTPVRAGSSMVMLQHVPLAESPAAATVYTPPCPMFCLAIIPFSCYATTCDASLAPFQYMICQHQI
jgi:hypothetical protein